MRVDEEDLRLVKLAAQREGMPAAELIRRAFHLVAMSTRTWDEPFFDQPLDLIGPVGEAEVRQAVADAIAANSGLSADWSPALAVDSAP